MPPAPAKPGRKPEGLPTRILPVLYFGVARIALASAFAAVALDPVAVAGFFYHARIVAIVHLVTLGWISGSILGAMYVVGPLVLWMPMPARRLDYWAWAFFTLGTMGMVSHFWSESFNGMAWSATMVVLGFVLVSVSVLRNLRATLINRAVKLHITLAFLNVLGAGTMGVLLGFDKVFHFLPGYVLSNVYAHAHLAAVGWVLMMVVGIGYRMLPMILPSAIPEGKSVYLSAVLLETGIVGLFITLVSGSRWVPFFALVIAGGVAAFLGHVIWMKWHARPAPAALPQPDYGVWYTAQVLTYLALAMVVGLGPVVLPLSDATLRVVLPYGVFGLVGFLAQIAPGNDSPSTCGWVAYRRLRRGSTSTSRPYWRSVAGAFWRQCFSAPSTARRFFVTPSQHSEMTARASDTPNGSLDGAVPSAPARLSQRFLIRSGAPPAIG